MPIPSLVYFKEQTKLNSKYFSGRRGKNISKIDKVISQYHQTGFQDVNGKAIVLSRMLAICARWLKEKAEKTGTNTSNRRFHIEQLAKAAFLELKSFENEKTRVLTPMDRFNHNKSVHTRNLVTKPLHNGYHLERSHYLHNEKTSNPISGPAIDNRWHSAKERLDYVSSKISNPQQREQFRVMLQKNSWTEVTPVEVEMLARYFDWESSIGRVEFVKKEERISKYMVVYKGHSVDFETGEGKPYDTKCLRDKHMFSVDSYGNLFASEYRELGKGLNWNHSSYNAGKDVVCAGNLRVVQGKLVYIDNLSGHYRPQRAEMHALLKLFQDERVDLNGVEIRFRTGPHPQKKGYVEVQVMSALSLLQDINFQGEKDEMAED